MDRKIIIESIRQISSGISLEIMVHLLRFINLVERSWFENSLSSMRRSKKNSRKSTNQKKMEYLQYYHLMGNSW